MASLQTTLLTINDTRSPSGLRHPLSAILLHAVVAMLGGARSYQAIAQFGRDRGRAFADAIGYTHAPMPCKATFSNVFRALPAGVFDQALRQWADGRSKTKSQKLALDGKTACGSARGSLPGLHLLSMFDHESKTVMDQMAVGSKTNEHKKALELLDLIDMEGKIVTGDAAFCQRDLSRRVVKKKAIISGR